MGLFEASTDCIIDITIFDPDSATAVTMGAVDKMLSHKEREKKNKYLNSCLQQRRSFLPFAVTCDGVLAPDAQSVLQRIAGRLSEKWSRPYSVVKAYVNHMISISLARSLHRSFRASHILPKRISAPSYIWHEAQSTYCLLAAESPRQRETL